MDVIQQEAGTWQRLTGSTNGHTALCPPHGHPKPLLELVPSPKATLWIKFTIQGKTTPSSQEPAKSTQGPTAGSDKGQPPGAPGHPVLWPLRLLQSPFFPCAPGPLVGVGFLLRVWAPQLPSLIRISKAPAPGLCLPVLFLLAACPLPAARGDPPQRLAQSQQWGRLPGSAKASAPAGQTQGRRRAGRALARHDGPWARPAHGAFLLHLCDAGISAPTLQRRRQTRKCLGKKGSNVSGFMEGTESGGFVAHSPLSVSCPKGPLLCFLLHGRLLVT